MAVDFRFLATTFVLLGISGTTDADIVHQIKFSQQALVMVWTGNDAPLVGQSVKVGPAPTRIEIDPIPVQTGRLVPVAGHPIDTSGSQQVIFRIASNAPFAIRARAALGHDVADLPFALRLGQIGPNAAPLDRTGAMSSVTLRDLEGGAIIYRAPRRTAAKPGSPSSQAIEFIAEWPGAHELDVELTVFTYAPGPN